MPTISDKWKELILTALTKVGLISPRFSGKVTFNISEGGIRTVDITQTVK